MCGVPLQIDYHVKSVQQCPKNQAEQPSRPDLVPLDFIGYGSVYVWLNGANEHQISKENIPHIFVDISTRGAIEYDEESCTDKR